MNKTPFPLHQKNQSIASPQPLFFLGGFGRYFEFCISKKVVFSLALWRLKKHGLEKEEEGGGGKELILID